MGAIMETVLNALGAQISIIVALLWVAIAIMLTYIRAFNRGKSIGYQEGFVAGKLVRKSR
jgi:hypothetical protein